MKMIWTPPEIFARVDRRLTHKKPKTNVFNRNNEEPHFKKYYKSSIIQFNRTTAHYRLIKYIGKDRIILQDGENYEIIEDKSAINTIVSNLNYIYGFKTYEEREPMPTITY